MIASQISGKTVHHLLLLLGILSLISCQNSPVTAQLSQLPLPEDCRQLLLVLTDDWNSSAGHLQRYVRAEDGDWEAFAEPVPVAIGRSGLGWGRGLERERTGEVANKKEGDGKAPSGVFALGTAFGYAKNPPVQTTFPYRQATARDFFVDDPQSPDYNQWVRLSGPESEPSARWKSFERMRREDHLYEFGIVVRHNMDPAKPGAGSAIFLHVWREPGSPTAGCTAMAREDIIELLAWLEPGKKPTLVQIPRSELSTLTQP